MERRQNSKQRVSKAVIE